jgi:hypothetical protein
MLQKPWLPDKWDKEADVVVVGFGGAGAAAAITAHDLGARVLMLEKAPAGEHGGNTRVAGQGYLQIYDVEKAITYLNALCGPFTVPQPMVRAWAEEVSRNNDWVTSIGGDPQEHQHQPEGIEFPELPGADCAHKFHNGPVYGYSKTWEFFESAAKQRPLEILYESPGRELIQDGATKEILGVRAEQDGRSVYVKARKAVILTCGGFENNQEMIRNYLPGLAECYTTGSPYNEGDGIRMAQMVGADLWHMNNYAGPSMALKVAEYKAPFSMLLLHYSHERPGGMIVVGPDAKRFTDEKFHTRHGKIKRHEHWMPMPVPTPMFIVFDHTVFSGGPLYDAKPASGWGRIPVEQGQSCGARARLDQARRDDRRARARDRARSRCAQSDGFSLESVLHERERHPFRTHEDAESVRRTAVLRDRVVALDAQYAGRSETERARADRAPGRYVDPAALQRGRARLDLQLSLSGHRQYRRMSRLRAHQRTQCRR